MIDHNLITAYILLGWGIAFSMVLQAWILLGVFIYCIGYLTANELGWFNDR